MALHCIGTGLSPFLSTRQDEVGKKKSQSFCFSRGEAAEEEPFHLAKLGTFSPGISDILDFIRDRYEIGALLSLSGTAYMTLGICKKQSS